MAKKYTFKAFSFLIPTYNVICEGIIQIFPEMVSASEERIYDCLRANHMGRLSYFYHRITRRVTIESITLALIGDP